MEVVHICPDVRYWSKLLSCTILIHVNDLEFFGFIFIGKTRFMQAMLSCDSSCFVFDHVEYLVQ